jgi:hypothetical protein
MKGGGNMATTLNRLTFAVTKEMEPLLDNAKKSQFYNCTQSEMIRELLMIGLDVLEKKDSKRKMV